MCDALNFQTMTTEPTHLLASSFSHIIKYVINVLFFVCFSVSIKRNSSIRIFPSTRQGHLDRKNWRWTALPIKKCTHLAGMKVWSWNKYSLCIPIFRIITAVKGPDTETIWAPSVCWTMMSRQNKVYSLHFIFCKLFVLVLPFYPHFNFLGTQLAD